MQDEWRKSRQLNAASRLRAMQRERAQLAYNRSLRELAQAEHRLRVEQVRYDSVQAHHEASGCIGATLDPSQHEQRLLAQTAAFQRLEAAHQPVIEARSLSHSAMSQLLKCKVNEDLIDKAKDRLQVLLDKAAREYEAIDIFDAQQAQGMGHGR
ncbi:MULTISPECIES: hypothetical protein [unclassified Pseudomonas]|uniref:hypothetical protein n=1 Tax=unclassified Pseudomonas TaxID=196821 RepID=UPI00087668F0|nr:MULTISPECIES: hypothetical protein [unclassified Pseudomonas]SCZ19677.1 hypothetical protein SAMN03159405_00315 [Pseudomonas sp. NFACC44-2]SDA45888.1 hypothetical protein SAMN03159429_00586 [Pseudomonas sp. NFACC51]SEI44416.1 hypothetical protein SAMN03159298_00316 [Pseudomonas sp. NFACC07-1]SFH04894.1 hypothetical protein SAMN03159302_00313 [Pseudomonas sp. NFACC54]SFS39471.1 hypothetical protein SAMN03159306_00314 [Pseudomonas sp. NFACC48-1]